MTENPQIFLASSSPRRQELLDQMGVSFKVIPQFAEEKHDLLETPEAFVSRLALEKATDGLLRQSNQKIPVLGSDTAVIFDGNILGKPKDKEQAIDMLLSLSNQTHQVLTAVALKNKQQTEQILSMTEVSFSEITREMCENYWLTGEPVDKAGSYGIQGKGALFIQSIKGSYSGVMGLPVYETGKLLNKFGIHLL
ncbi:MAG: Maf family nucleotide pyrophosphatase [Gammaproteobacteria bacterium]|nr:Maf family nucleotide pyrophosphatase [Gammaproteobacteria bacterium]